MKKRPPEHAAKSAETNAGYDLCGDPTALKQLFLLRVGGNLHLLADLEYDWEIAGETVYLWLQQQQRDHHPPLQLRLIVAE